MKAILTAIDFSESTRHVLDYSIDLAKKFDAKLRLLHVAEPPPEFLGEDFGPKVVRDERANRFRKEHKQLTEYVEEISKKGIGIKMSLIQGSTVETILKQAQKDDAGFIVLGSKGRGAIAKAILGSVCEGIIKDANCPVVVIPHGAKTIK